MDASVIKGAGQFTGKNQAEVKEALHDAGVEWGDGTDKFVFAGKLWSKGGTRDVQHVGYTQLTHVGDDIPSLWPRPLWHSTAGAFSVCFWKKRAIRACAVPMEIGTAPGQPPTNAPPRLRRWIFVALCGALVARVTKGSAG